LAHPAASARLVAAAEAALRDAAVEAVQPQAAGRAEAARSAAQHAAAEVAAAAQHGAAGAAAAAQHGAVVAAAALHAAAGVAAEAAARVSAGVPQRAALALQAPALALPSAWVFHRDQVLPWPARPPSARFARATAGWRSALP
jgi:hypothetical protein